MLHLCTNRDTTRNYRPSLGNSNNVRSRGICLLNKQINVASTSEGSENVKVRLYDLNIQRLRGHVVIRDGPMGVLDDLNAPVPSSPEVSTFIQHPFKLTGGTCNGEGDSYSSSLKK